jgi:hypothetical protein
VEESFVTDRRTALTGRQQRSTRFQQGDHFNEIGSENRKRNARRGNDGRHGIRANRSA